jgi:carbon monoxide dehydrogenase subunit G
MHQSRPFPPLPARTPLWACVLVGALCALPARAVEPKPAVAEHDVQVDRTEHGFVVDVVMHATVSVAEAWAVMTDFDHMAEFIPNLHESRVVERADNLLKVSQKGVAHWGPLSMKLDSLREVRLVPMREIRGHGLAGSIKRFDSLMLIDAEPGGGTRLHYHAEVEPGTWFPPFVGPAKVRQDTAAQFSGILQEMTRRH